MDLTSFIEILEKNKNEEILKELLKLKAADIKDLSRSFKDCYLKMIYYDINTLEELINLDKMN